MKGRGGGLGKGSRASCGTDALGLALLSKLIVGIGVKCQAVLSIISSIETSVRGTQSLDEATESLSLLGGAKRPR